MNIVEVTTAYLEYYIYLIDKAVSGFERTDSSYERNSTVSKIMSSSIIYYREIFQERDSMVKLA